MRTHVTFSESFRRTLAVAFDVAGISEPILACPDDYSFGPLGSSEERCRFREEELGYECTDLVQRIDAFWDAVSRIAPASRVAWFHKRSAREHSNFMEYLARTRAGVDVVEVNDIYSGDVIAVHELREQVVNWPTSAVLRRVQEWEHLVSQGSLLRIVSNEALTSVGLDFFDNAIIGALTDDWLRADRLLGDLLAQLTTTYGAAQTSFDFLWSRLGILMERGTVEGYGEGYAAPDTLVRRLRAFP